MKIDLEVFAAYLDCPTKCFLLVHGERGFDSEYLRWVRQRSNNYREDRLHDLKNTGDRHAHYVSTSLAHDRRIQVRRRRAAATPPV